MAQDTMHTPQRVWRWPLARDACYAIQFARVSSEPTERKPSRCWAEAPLASVPRFRRCRIPAGASATPGVV